MGFRRGWRVDKKKTEHRESRNQIRETKQLEDMLFSVTHFIPWRAALETDGREKPPATSNIMSRVRARQLRTTWLALLLLTSCTQWQVPVATAFPDPAAAELTVPIVARVSSGDDCPANFYSCALQGAQWDGICCPYDQVCSITSDGEPACCPAGYFS